MASYLDDETDGPAYQVPLHRPGEGRYEPIPLHNPADDAGAFRQAERPPPAPPAWQEESYLTRPGPGLDAAGQQFVDDAAKRAPKNDDLPDPDVGQPVFPLAPEAVNAAMAGPTARPTAGPGSESYDRAMRSGGVVGNAPSAGNVLQGTTPGYEAALRSGNVGTIAPVGGVPPGVRPSQLPRGRIPYGGGFVRDYSQQPAPAPGGPPSNLPPGFEPGAQVHPWHARNGFEPTSAQLAVQRAHDGGGDVDRDVYHTAVLDAEAQHDGFPRDYRLTGAEMQQAWKVARAETRDPRQQAILARHYQDAWQHAKAERIKTGALVREHQRHEKAMADTGQKARDDIKDRRIDELKSQAEEHKRQEKSRSDENQRKEKVQAAAREKHATDLKAHKDFRMGIITRAYADAEKEVAGEIEAIKTKEKNEEKRPQWTKTGPNRQARIEANAEARIARAIESARRHGVDVPHPGPEPGAQAQPAPPQPAAPPAAAPPPAPGPVAAAPPADNFPTPPDPEPIGGNL